MIVFGPVPSRRLGRSLGINNIPPKHCSYSCLYCQVGRTSHTEINPRNFYTPEQIVSSIKLRLATLEREHEAVDYLTFVPDGEPTLDKNLGTSIKLLRDQGIKIAVISNASLIWRKDVREALQLADWVSLKVDSVDETCWQHINRPDSHLDLQSILSSVLSFAGEFDGFLATETMLLQGINTADECIERLADYLGRLQPHKAYLAIPTRPTAETGVAAPDAERLNHIYQTVKQRVAAVELLTGYEGDAFAASGDPAKDLLEITSVHPMRKDAVMALLAKTRTDWSLVDELIQKNQLRQLDYRGQTYYLRAYRQQT
ncbi:radical SAM protein [Methylomarinum vadi]|uniref:radical SAM protein n=1 Tax=Methylomarinum vadi TaxID=438855 RepID=UPI0004DF24F7|nr:radical SAM protein [Methylomarinum vadi]